MPLLVAEDAIGRASAFSAGGPGKGLLCRANTRALAVPGIARVSVPLHLLSFLLPRSSAYVGAIQWGRAQRYLGGSVLMSGRCVGCARAKVKEMSG